MRIRLYSVKDRLLGVYLSPFPARADLEARRQIMNSMRDPAMANQPLVTNPADYELYYLATLDDETGSVFPEAHAAGPVPTLLCNCAALAAVAPITEPLEAPHGDPV